jgi:hypothetical protein
MSDCCDHERQARIWRGLYDAINAHREELHRLLLEDMPLTITHIHYGPKCYRCQRPLDAGEPLRVCAACRGASG